MPTITLRQRDARLLYLALIYHLARPGSELDRQTGEPLPHGLLETARSLHGQINDPSASLELDAVQAERLKSALLGTVNELKIYPVLTAAAGGERRSMVPRFDETLRLLFPQVEAEPEETLELAARMVALRRESESGLAASPPAAPDAPPGPQRRRRWRFWKK